MATLRAARAIGQSHVIGSIAVGKASDVVVFKVVGNDPLREILESDVLPEQTWINSQRVAPASAS
jgi:imidazolonepropionase-like amidohydrolase